MRGPDDELDEDSKHGNHDDEDGDVEHVVAQPPGRVRAVGPCEAAAAAAAAEPPPRAARPARRARRALPAFGVLRVLLPGPNGCVRLRDEQTKNTKLEPPPPPLKVEPPSAADILT